MLEFINTAGPETGKDQQTRRKVRSQAMRDFRRRQRAENERKRNSKSPSLVPSKHRDRSASDTVVPIARSSSKPSRRSQQYDTAQSEQGHLRPHGTSTFSLDLNETAASYVGEQIYWESDQVVVTPPLDGRDAFYQNPAILTSGRPSPALSLSASRAQSESSEGFDTQSHVDQMFEFCKSYMSWLCPELDSNSAAEVLTSRQNITASPTSLAALCLASVGHFGAVRQGGPAFDYDLCKARVFRDINERMKTSATAVTDETVGYLACLLSYEMSNCNKEATLHLYGLKSIINMKGGMDTLSEPLIMMLECLDLTHALMFDTDPMITVADPSSDASQSRMDTYQGACSVLRLLGNENDDFQQMLDHEHAPFRERLQTLPELFKCIASILSGYMEEQNETSASLKAERADIFKHALERCREMSIVPDASAPDAHYLARIVYLRALLIYNVSVHHLEASHPVNQSTLHGMWDTAWKIRESTWTTLPYLRLWILIGGTTIAQDPTQKAFFKAHLIRLVFRLGVSEWRRVKTFIIRYISSKTLGAKMLEQPDDNSIYALAPERSDGSSVLADTSSHNALGIQDGPHVRSSSVSMTQSDQNLRTVSVSDAIDASTTEMAYRATRSAIPASSGDASSAQQVQGWTGGSLASLQSYYNISEDWGPAR